MISQQVVPPSNRANIQLSRLPTIGRWVLLTGLLLGAVGASFAPWVVRPPAALVLTAPDLAEFVKFLPEVRDGSLRVYRLFFLLPLFVTTLALSVVVTACKPVYPRWVRWPVLFTVIPLSLTLLPPVWSPAVLLSAEFRPQTIACTLCLSLLAASRWLRHTPPRVLAVLLVFSSMVAPALALWQFFVVRGAIARAYASPITFGWGAWSALIGFALTVLGTPLTLWAIHVPARSDPHESRMDPVFKA